MSEPAPPGVAEAVAGDRAQALSPEAVERVLADFRSWLLQSAVVEPAPPADAIDLSTLLGQFTALRHEVNLQTKAVRAQQEQNAETLRQLTQALDAVQHVQEATEQEQEAAQEEQVRPLLKTLIELYDALALAGREIGRLQVSVLPYLQDLASSFQPETADDEPPRPSWLARLFGARPPDLAVWRRRREQQTERACQAREAAERIRQALGALTTGYTMGLQRVERALRQQGLEPIAATGQAFDPERMEVLEVVTDGSRPSGEVLDEVRRGYIWKGRVFRFAQVRVAKSVQV
jgi:molecular chaperone GrpE